MGSKKSKSVVAGVMQSVVRYEQGKISLFWRIFFFGILFVCLAAIIVVTVLVATLHSQGTLDVLSLFGEDSEIIRENIIDSLEIVYMETPPVFLWLMAGIICVSVFALIFTRKTRTITKKKESEINKYIHTK